MTAFAALRLPTNPTVVAPDGSDVRVLLGLPGGSMAHFQFRASASQSVAAVAITMPPWPGESQASIVQGRWESA